MAFVLILRQPTGPQVLMQWPVFHNVKKAFVHEFAFALMAEVWPTMQFGAPTFFGAFYMVAGIASVAQDHALLVGLPPAVCARAGIH